MGREDGGEPASKVPRCDPAEDPDLGEKQHFLDVSYSIADYERVALLYVHKFERRQQQRFADPLGQRLCDKKKSDQLVARMRFCVQQNQKVLMDDLVRDLDDKMVGPPSGLGALAPPPGILRVPRGYVVSPGNTSKALSTIRQFVRDWSHEGAETRENSYGPLLAALKRYVPLQRRMAKKVLTPGSGLGRLTFEAARLGYHAEGNEFSYHMLLGTLWVLNGVQAPMSKTIYPFVLDTAGRRGMFDHLRPVRIPDICPNDWCNPAKGFGHISMRSGEFCEVYSDSVSDTDAIMSAFFLDTANNVFHYIRSFAKILKPGGLWANMGPLLWHYSDEGGGAEDAVSIELAWDEVQPAIEQYFDIQELEQRDSLYTDSGAKQKLYHCMFMAAIRNDTPVTGFSHPVA